MNPLAIGVSLGGLLLDLVAPRPKPRAGLAYESLRSPQAVPRTPWRNSGFEEYVGAPVASGSSPAARVASRD
ncbi:MAG: hypothetical protein QOJ25_866 [Solirubrobacteraceae bacterium]|jgi:hypothetical protein|nr:hypothetical protein [Solirubrobacteraceae bacterium]